MAVHLSADIRNSPRFRFVARQLLLHGSALSHTRQDVQKQSLALPLCTQLRLCFNSTWPPGSEGWTTDVAAHRLAS